MIFHFLYDLQQQFPTYEIYAEGLEQDSIQEFILLREMPGSARGYPDNRIQGQIQITVRNHDMFLARQISGAIFDYMRERHNVTLQQHPDDSSGVGDLFVRHIVAMQPPYPMGRDGDGPFRYVNNYQITYQNPT